jgi:transposase-like protein
MIEVKCPKCGSKEVIKYGKSHEGKQRYKCKNRSCNCTTFIMNYSYTGAQPNIESSIIKMTANASGIRDISRVLGISTTKVMSTLKKRNLQQVTLILSIF